MSIEAMKQALDALKRHRPKISKGSLDRIIHDQAITALRAAIEQGEKQEPVEIDGNTSDGYHTFNELYEFRKAYNAALFNEWAAGGKCSVHKSWRHHNGELCFGGGWFIVVAVLPQGQISNHYEAKDWNLFDVPETERALFEFDGHTGSDVVARLKAYTASPTAPRQEQAEKRKDWQETYGRIIKALAQMCRISGSDELFDLGGIPRDPVMGLVQDIRVAIDEYDALRQEKYDQTSLELCKECGWKALIPGEGCLVCARQKAKPVWIQRNHLESAQREPSMCRVEPTKRLPDFVPLYTAPPAVTQTPVAYVDERIHGWPDCFVMEPDPPHTTPLYTEPPTDSEPFAYSYMGIRQDGSTHGPHLVWKPEYMDAMSASKGAVAIPLYTAPRQWVGLTNDEIVQAMYKADEIVAGSTQMNFVRAIEAKLKEKNAP